MEEETEEEEEEKQEEELENEPHYHFYESTSLLFCTMVQICQKMGLIPFLPIRSATAQHLLH